MLIVVAFASGLALWTFMEYVLHRFAGHLPRGRTLPSREHLAHHTRPTYFTPAWKKVALAAPILGAYALVGSALAGVALGLAFTLGVTIGWLAYELWHRSIHQRAPRSAWGRRMARHHLAHHFGHPNQDHGVTVAFWDRVFGTYVRPEVVRIPARHVLPWMLDPAGDLAPSWQRDYLIVGQARESHRAEPVQGALPA